MAEIKERSTFERLTDDLLVTKKAPTKKVNQNTEAKIDYIKANSRRIKRLVKAKVSLAKIAKLITEAAVTDSAITEKVGTRNNNISTALIKETLGLDKKKES